MATNAVSGLRSKSLRVGLEIQLGSTGQIKLMSKVQTLNGPYPSLGYKPVGLLFAHLYFLYINIKCIYIPNRMV